MIKGRNGLAKRWSLPAMVLGIVWVAAPGAALAQGAAENPAEACAKKNQVDAATVGPYQFAAYKSNDGACLQVTSGGKVVYTQSADSFETYTLGACLSNHVFEVNRA